MLKYVMAAAALKGFSMNRATKHLYRQISNVIGEKGRMAVADIDIRVDRGDLLIDLCRKHSAVTAGDSILEIGTGWMHFYSLYLRLFFDLRVTALDIWDNRQFRALQAAACKLLSIFESRGMERTSLDTLRQVLSSKDFPDLYEKLGYQYVIEPTGAISQFRDAEFSFITSFHVLEHVPTQYVEQLARDMFRKLRPGGYTIHQIGIDDHLTHYDASASEKQYLKYSDRQWKLLFENEVQYFNRLQTSDWLRYFREAGFELREMISAGTDISSLSVDARFGGYPREDLECTCLTLVYRKPG